jgi:hypothetical protein
MSMIPRREGGPEDAVVGGAAGLAGAVSRPLAIDLEKFSSKELVRLHRKCIKFGAFLE